MTNNIFKISELKKIISGSVKEYDIFININRYNNIIFALSTRYPEVSSIKFDFDKWFKLLSINQKNCYNSFTDREKTALKKYYSKETLESHENSIIGELKLRIKNADNLEIHSLSLSISAYKYLKSRNIKSIEDIIKLIQDGSIFKNIDRLDDINEIIKEINRVYGYNYNTIAINEDLEYVDNNSDKRVEHLPKCIRNIKGISSGVEIAKNMFLIDNDGEIFIVIKGSYKIKAYIKIDILRSIMSCLTIKSDTKGLDSELIEMAISEKFNIKYAMVPVNDYTQSKIFYNNGFMVYNRDEEFLYMKIND